MVAAASVCSLCGQSTRNAILGLESEVFCCHACKEVAALLAETPADRPAATPNQEVTYGVRGLWCSSCAWLVEERLKRMPGVGTARVNYLERRARIAFDSDKIAPEDIQRRIRSLGYRTESEEDSGNDEAFYTRLLVGGLLAMHIMVTSLIMYARDWMGLSGPDSAWLEHIFYLMQFVISLPLAVILGLPILRAGVNGLLRGLPNVQTLVSIGALAALALSTRNLFAGTGHVYFDTAAMLFFLLTIGRWLEMRAHDSGRTSFDELRAGLPDEVRLVTADEERLISLSDVRPGMRLRLAPGDRIPVDGRIADGSARVDEAMLTGEAMPVSRGRGEDIFAGTINTDGLLDLIVVRTGDQTRAGRLGELLEEWVWQRSPAVKLADRLAAWMVYAAIAVAGLTFAGYALAVDLETGLLNSLSVLLIACPCALGIATPLTLRQAFNRAVENGILLRRADLLERLPDIRRIYFDKTGTLTENHHQVVRWTSIGDMEGNALRYAAALERHAGHPLSGAILEYAETLEIDVPEVVDLQTIAGKGVQGEVEGVCVRVGSLAFMEEHGLQTADPKLAAFMASGSNEGVAVYVGWGDRVRSAAIIGELPRPALGTLFSNLRSLGLAPAVLTGNSRDAGARWQAHLGIPVFAGLSPEEKLAILSAPGEGSIMVGDGINDGPALAAASVGIALRGGSDLARSAAEITLIEDELLAIPWLLRLGFETRRRLRQNLGWAVGYNLVGIVLAVSGLLQPVLAALAMVLSSALVTRNALQLRKFDRWKAEAGESTEDLSNSPEILVAETQSQRASFD